MAIVVTYADGPWAGRSQIFDDAYDRIVIGRNEDLCQVVLPRDDPHVGGEHCELRRKAGRYRLLINRVHRVFVDGEPARDDYELPDTAVLRLGEGGPHLSMSMVVVDTDQHRTHTVRIPKPVPGKITEIHRRVLGAQSAALRGQRIAGIALALLLGGILFGVATHLDTKGKLLDAQSSSEQQATRLAQAQRDLEDTQRALSQAKSELEQTRSLIVSTEAHIAERAGQMERQIAELRKHAEQMHEALRTTQPSVYLVVAYDARSQVLGMATSWVFDRERGLLATNAHVARLFDRPGVDRLIVRAMARNFDAPPPEHRVVGVTLHPGYALFPRLVQQSVEGISDRSIAAQVNKLTGGCDVALLEVDGKDQLAPALRIAPAERLARLGAGEAVAYVGFPSDLVGGFDYRYPAPLLQIGTIVTVTDFFLMPASRGDGQLVQVSMPAVGGASGSPVINAQGEVIATMSSVQGTRGEDGRVRADYKGVNFAQRVDLTVELPTLDAAAANALRERWEASFRRHFVHTLDRAGLEAFYADLRRQWLDQVPYVGFQAATVIDEEITSDRMEGDTAMVVREAQLEAGQYVLMAIASDKRNVDAEVRLDAKKLTGPAREPRFYTVKAFTLERAATVNIALERRSTSSPFTCTLRCVHLVRQPTTPELRAAKRDALVQQVRDRNPGLEFTPVPLPFDEVTLAQPISLGRAQAYSWRHVIPAQLGGSYLVIAIAHGDEDIDLAVREGSRSERVVDEESDSYPVALLKDVPANGAVDVLVVTQIAPDLRASIWVYRSEPAR